MTQLLTFSANKQASGGKKIPVQNATDLQHSALYANLDRP
jgi:hypothetical protein